MPAKTCRRRLHPRLAISKPEADSPHSSVASPGPPPLPPAVTGSGGGGGGAGAAGSSVGGGGGGAVEVPRPVNSVCCQQAVGSMFIALMCHVAAVSAGSTAAAHGQAGGRRSQQLSAGPIAAAVAVAAAVGKERGGISGV